MLIVKYNPDWVIHFQKIKEKLSKVLMDIEVNIEHVGSTSVPKLAAKPIIDIDIIYNEMPDFEHIKNQLASLGYFHNGNQGIEGREVFKRNGVNEDDILDKIIHHLYVCQYGCVELNRHILFRNYLIQHEIARNFYENLKRQIAKEANEDKKLYANLKEIKANSFIDYIVELSKIKK
jgi:GrpB-like predicted nucleotidyltransferase (UPF0157 family)